MDQLIQKFMWHRFYHWMSFMMQPLLPGLSALVRAFPLLGFKTAIQNNTPKNTLKLLCFFCGCYLLMSPEHHPLGIIFKHTSWGRQKNLSFQLIPPEQQWLLTLKGHDNNLYLSLSFLVAWKHKIAKKQTEKYSVHKHVSLWWMLSNH